METKDGALPFWYSLDIFNVFDYTKRTFSGLSKFYRFIFESHLDTVGTFDLLLLYTFVIIFLAFLVVSILTIFEKDQMSLHQIKSKVKHSTAMIATLATALWAIKETKFKSITYEGYMRIHTHKAVLLELQQKSSVENEKEEPKVVTENYQIKDKKKKSHKCLKAVKRDLSPTEVKSSPFPYLKRVKLGPSKNPKSSIDVADKTLKCLRSSSSSTLLAQKQPESVTPRSNSVSAAYRNSSVQKVGKRSFRIGDPTK